MKGGNGGFFVVVLVDSVQVGIFVCYLLSQYLEIEYLFVLLFGGINDFSYHTL